MHYKINFKFRGEKYWDYYPETIVVGKTLDNSMHPRIVSEQAELMAKLTMERLKLADQLNKVKDIKLAIREGDSETDLWKADSFQEDGEFCS